MMFSARRTAHGDLSAAHASDMVQELAHTRSTLSSQLISVSPRTPPPHNKTHLGHVAPPVRAIFRPMLLLLFGAQHRLVSPAGTAPHTPSSICLCIAARHACVVTRAHDRRHLLVIHAVV